MRILIASGIFPPEIGGPATFAPEIARQFIAAGIDTEVITYANTSTDERIFPFPVFKIIRSRNKLKQYLTYFLLFFRHSARCDLVYALDWFSAGVPVLIACKLRRKPYIVRVGGGYIWEKYLTQGRPPVTLREFYERKLHLHYPLMYLLIRLVLRNARLVIFNSDQQRDLYEKQYDLSPRHTKTIYNAAPEMEIKDASRGEKHPKEIVYAGRFTKMKNVESLIRAFAEVTDHTFHLLLIGEGPVENELHCLVEELALSKRVTFSPPLSGSALWQRILGSYVVVIPSWTEISPHQAYECLALSIPVLITRENFLPFRDKLLSVNPASAQDIAEKLNYLSVPDNYKKYVGQLRDVSVNRPWNQVMAEHKEIFSTFAEK